MRPKLYHVISRLATDGEVKVFYAFSEEEDNEGGSLYEELSAEKQAAVDEWLKQWEWLKADNK